MHCPPTCSWILENLLFGLGPSHTHVGNLKPTCSNRGLASHTAPQRWWLVNPVQGYNIKGMLWCIMIPRIMNILIWVATSGSLPVLSDSSLDSPVSSSLKSCRLVLPTTLPLCLSKIRPDLIRISSQTSGALCWASVILSKHISFASSFRTSWFTPAPARVKDVWAFSVDLEGRDKKLDFLNCQYADGLFAYRDASADHNRVPVHPFGWLAFGSFYLLVPQNLLSRMFAPCTSDFIMVIIYYI